MTRSLEELDAAIAALERLTKPLTWVGQIITYTDWYFGDLHMYEAKWITKVCCLTVTVKNKNGQKDKTKFDSDDEMIFMVEDWLRIAKNFNTYPGVE